MRDEVLPLFPLPLVLFPRTPLPLHIFEDRYKEMIGEAIEQHSEFGMVFARENQIASAGCTATVEKVAEKYSDGRMDIVTVGRRRFHIRELVNDRSFPRAKVSFFEDDDLAAPEDTLRSLAAEGFRRARQQTGESEVAEPIWDDPQLSFQLAQILEDLEIRQNLLSMRSEVQRLQRIVAYFPIFVTRHRHAEQVRAAAPRNGHSKIIPFNER